MAKRYERTARLKLMRMNIILAGLEVKSPKANTTTTGHSNSTFPPGSASSANTAGGTLPMETAIMGSAGSIGSGSGPRLNTESSQTEETMDMFSSRTGTNMGSSTTMGASARFGDGGEGLKLNSGGEGM